MTAPNDFAQYVTDSQTYGLASSFWTFEFPGGYWATVSPGMSPLCLDLEASDPTLNVCDADPRMVLDALRQLRDASTAQPIDPTVDRVRDPEGNTWHRARAGSFGGWISEVSGAWSAESDLLAMSSPLTPVAPADAQATPTAPEVDDQGDQPAAYCPYCDQTVPDSRIGLYGQHKTCGHAVQFA